MDINQITKQVAGKRVSHVTAPGDCRLAIHLADGSALVIEAVAGEAAPGDGPPGNLAIYFTVGDRSAQCPAALEATLRQREYLEFIRKYMARFDVAPAESDIQRHVMVSAPSVHQMVQSLERQGFITRQPMTARSIRLVEATHCFLCGGNHLLKKLNPGRATRR